MPYTELHRHLDACLRPATLADLINQYKIEVPFCSKGQTCTEELVRKNFWLTKQMSSLEEVLSCFLLFQKVLCNLEVLERVGKEAVEDAIAEGITKLELRFSPSFATELSNISWSEALFAFKRGIDSAIKQSTQAPQVGLICIISRDYGVREAKKTIDFAMEHRKHFIGIDLAGAEAPFPCTLFKDAFKRAAGFSITVHAGESASAKNIWDAIDVLGAHRIGHGIRAIDDKELMQRLARDNILLEICPTSNYITRSIATWAEHPLPRFLDAGIPVSIGTDDPGIFGVNLLEEYERCKAQLKMSSADLDRVKEYSRKYSFLPNGLDL